MTKETFKKGMKRFLLVFRDNIDVNADMQVEWFRLLEDLEDVRFLFAVDQICKNYTYFGKVHNFVALIRDYSNQYVEPERPRKSIDDSEHRKVRITKFKEKLKEERGIDYDSLGKTEEEKCKNYVKMLKNELKDEPDNPMSNTIFNVIGDRK